MVSSHVTLDLWSTYWLECSVKQNYFHCGQSEGGRARQGLVSYNSLRGHATDDLKRPIIPLDKGLFLQYIA